MSKAFTRESDTEDDEVGLPPLPAGGKNYITPQGYADLRAELFDLIDNERPKVVDIVHWAASNGDRLEIAEVTDPTVHFGKDQVFFGATVTYVEEDGDERTVTILGIDEADSLKGEVTWISPIARALIKAREGDVVKLVTPVGVQEIEVLSVNYPQALQ